MSNATLNGQTNFKEIVEDLRALYLADPRPWLVGFSGGKDSTLVGALVFEAILGITAEKRKKEIHVVCTDTRVEIPAIVEMVEGTLAKMQKFSQENSLNVEVHLLRPPAEQSFWVNIIGRGYRAHLQMLKAASKQKPSDNASEGWQKFGYYPRILNREISEGYKEVLRHLEVYQEAGDEIIWKLLGRMHDSRREAFRNLLANLSYYERNADAYAAKFDNFDLSELRAKFKAAVQNDASKRESLYGQGAPKLLEAGCGTGRDVAAFIRDGFAVTAFDVSPAMGRKCNRRIRELRSNPDPQIAERAINSVCDEKTFDEVQYRNEFDAVWASASLLHLPKRDLPDAIQRLTQSLKLDGVMFMSFKYGIGEAEFDSRHYSHFRRRELRTTLSKIAGAEVLEVWLTDRSGKTLSNVATLFAALRLTAQRRSGCWVNVLVKKSLR